MKKKITAFTLAEVLLTLVIIGVVAALTIPTVKDNSDEVKYVAATKKAFSTISAATTANELKHGDGVFWKFDDAKTIDWYKESMNLVPPDPEKTSWAMTSISGADEGNFVTTLMGADGMTWSIGTENYSCGGGAALVDVNGPQSPNVIGLDIHGFRIGSKCNGATRSGDFGVYPMGDGANDNNAKWACTAYVMKSSKMPWLKDTTIQNCESLVGQ